MTRLIWLVIVAAACGKGSKDADDQAAEPFQGPLTVAKVMGTQDKVRLLAPWDKAFAKLEAAVGVPTKVEGDKFYWAAMEGDDCAYFVVSREDGKPYQKTGMVVGSIQSPMTVGKDGAIMNRAECLTLVGKGVAAEDPAVAAPRTEGAAYEVGEVMKLAVAGRSKWKGQQVKVAGTVRQMMGDEARLFDRGNDELAIACKLAAGAAPPPIGKPAVMQGTVEIREFVRGTGEPGMDAELASCSVVDEAVAPAP